MNLGSTSETLAKVLRKARVWEQYKTVKESAGGRSTSYVLKEEKDGPKIK